MSEVHKDNDHNNAWLQPNTLQITTRAGKLTRGLCLVSCHYFIPTFSFCSYFMKHLGDLLMQVSQMLFDDTVKSQSYKIAHYNSGEKS